MVSVGVPMTGAIVSLLVATLLTTLAAVLQRSGAIRLRRWADEVGGALGELYDRRSRFDALRLLLSLLSRMANTVFYAWVVVIFAYSGARHPFTSALGVLLLVLAAVEILIRNVLGRDPERALSRFSSLYRLAFLLLGPLLPLVAPLLPHEPEEGDSEEATSEEIDAFIDVARREGILEAGEGELVRGLVDFGDTQVGSVMTPRVDIITASLDSSLEELRELVLRTGHSRIPLYRDSVDDIVGVLHVRDLLRLLPDGSAEDIPALLQPPHFVPETKALTELLRDLQERHQELAIVVGEYGETEGVVTIEDLLEEIFGEIVDEHDEDEPEAQALEDGAWRVDGRLRLEELEELLRVAIDDEEYETVGGAVFGHLGRVPRVGDRVAAYGLELEVEEADHRRALAVRVAIETPAEEEDEPSVHTP